MCRAVTMWQPFFVSKTSELFKKHYTLFVISKIMVTMENATGGKIDFVENGRLLPFATESAEHDKVLIYERES